MSTWRRHVYLPVEELLKFGLPRTGAENAFMLAVKGFSMIGYGRMLQMISLLWFSKDHDGALSVGECYMFLKDKKGRYRAG